jgi:hypothetical protein
MLGKHREPELTVEHEWLDRTDPRTAIAADSAYGDDSWHKKPLHCHTREAGSGRLEVDP